MTTANITAQAGQYARSSLDLIKGTVRLDSVFHKDLRSGAILRGAAFVLLICTVLLVITALANHKAIADANSNAVTALRGGVSLYNNPGWAGRLLFPLYFGIIFLVWGSLRYAMLTALDQANRSWLVCFGITVLGLTPFMLSGAIQGLLNNLVPVLPPLEASAVPLVRVYGALLVTLAAFVWEAILVMRALIRAYSFNRGKAILTWAAPYVSLVLLFVLATLLLSLST